VLAFFVIITTGNVNKVREKSCQTSFWWTVVIMVIYQLSA